GLPPPTAASASVPATVLPYFSLSAQPWYARESLAFCLHVPATPEIYTLSLHDALPISARRVRTPVPRREAAGRGHVAGSRQEQPLGSSTGVHAVRVRGLDAAERRRLQQEAQLLAALEVAGVGAAPTVLELEDDGYV